MRVGILGGGQLGRMIALAGYPLGITTTVLEPASESSAAQVCARIQGDFDDYRALYQLASVSDVITYEFENVPVESVRWLAERLPTYPSAEALETAQDRILEKQFFANLEIPVPPFAAVDIRDDFDTALERIGLPAVLKTRRFGYDGKGQEVLRTVADAERAWEHLGGRPLILEGFVAFDRELSLIAVRSTVGEIICYPLVQNTHEAGMLRLTLAPAPNLSPGLQQEAERYAKLTLQRLNYVGVLAIEFFESKGRLSVNEMAPRVHNSGHWSIEGSETSQFENHIRAILGWKLGATTCRGVSAMWNLIGDVPHAGQIVTVNGAKLHLYGKSSRPNRKVGHITICGVDESERDERLIRLREVMP